MTIVAHHGHPTASVRAPRIHRALLVGALTVSLSSTLGTPLIPTIVITVAVGAGLGFPVTGLIAQHWARHTASAWGPGPVSSRQPGRGGDRDVQDRATRRAAAASSARSASSTIRWTSSPAGTTASMPPMPWPAA